MSLISCILYSTVIDFRFLGALRMQSTKIKEIPPDRHATLRWQIPWWMSLSIGPRKTMHSTGRWSTLTGRRNNAQTRKIWTHFAGRHAAFFCSSNPPCKRNDLPPLYPLLLSIGRSSIWCLKCGCVSRQATTARSAYWQTAIWTSGFLARSSPQVSP